MNRFRATPALLLAFALWFSSSCSAPNPGSVVKRFYFLLSAGQTSAAMNECSRELKAFGPKFNAALEQAAREIQQKGGVESVEIEDLEVEKQVAKLVALINFMDGSTNKERHVLVLEDGRWRLSASK